jgi:hypothetical protein
MSLQSELRQNAETQDYKRSFLSGTCGELEISLTVRSNQNQKRLPMPSRVFQLHFLHLL